MARKMDAGITQTDAIAVSKCVNGDVAIQNLNGLEIRLQSILFLRNILADTHSSALSESMTFSWRRNSRQEEVKDENGKVVKDKNGNIKKKYFLRESPWTIDVPLNKQIP